jgi:hypothetical protein
VRRSSPTSGLLIGLVITLAAVVTDAWYTTRQLSVLQTLQTDLADRSRKDSLQLLRIQNDLNSLALAMRDMLDNDEHYPLTEAGSQRDNPEARVAVLHALSGAQMALGEFDRAAALLTEAASLPQDGSTLARGALLDGNLARLRGDDAAASAAYGRAIAAPRPVRWSRAGTGDVRGSRWIRATGDRDRLAYRRTKSRIYATVGPGGSSKSTSR